MPLIPIMTLAFAAEQLRLLWEVLIVLLEVRQKNEHKVWTMCRSVKFVLTNLLIHVCRSIWMLHGVAVIYRSALRYSLEDSVFNPIHFI